MNKEHGGAQHDTYARSMQKSPGSLTLLLAFDTLQQRNLRYIMDTTARSDTLSHKS